MSDENTPAEGTAAPAVQPDATQQTANSTPDTSAQPAIVPVEKPRIMATELPEDALKSRLADERRKGVEDAYRSLGKSESEIKALIEAEQARADAQKTLEQRVADRDAALEAEKKRVAVMAETIRQQAEYEMSLLDDKQREAISDIASMAGDASDPSVQLRALRIWQKQQPSSVPAASPAVQTAPVPAPTASPVPAPAPAAPPKPLGTAGAPSAPGEGTPAGESNHRAKYEELLKTNPFAAAAYGEKYAREVYRPQS